MYELNLLKMFLPRADVGLRVLIVVTIVVPYSREPFPGGVREKEATENLPLILTFMTGFLLFFFLILRRMGENKALAHHTSTYFHTRRVSI